MSTMTRVGWPSPPDHESVLLKFLVFPHFLVIFFALVITIRKELHGISFRKNIVAATGLLPTASSSASVGDAGGWPQHVRPGTATRAARVRVHVPAENDGCDSSAGREGSR